MNTSRLPKPGGAVTDVEELCSSLRLPKHRTRAGILENCPEFPLKVPRSWLARMASGDADDPLLRQVLPSLAEHAEASGYCDDPTGDAEAVAVGGILHKYRHRVLLIATGACAIHCRYCFRRHFPYREHGGARRLQAAVAYIEDQPDVEEVIVSGGDPLTLANHKLFDLCERLEAVPHVARVRIHARLPVADPARLDDALIAWSRRRAKPYILVIHANHPNEINDEVRCALRRMRHWTLLNQAVLLRGVNDDAEVLARLCLRCFDAGVLPYYLHLLDPVRGAAHFEVEEQTARALMRAVSARLPGYLVPKLVRETPGAAAKTVVA